ncbi:MAG: transposase [Thermoguttaceae bacterium]|jgi:type I restriction enzyme R subunit
MVFELFDPAMDVRITAGDLPHWYQPGVTYFITYRTADSLPTDVAELWYRHRDDWLRRHGVDPRAPRWRERLRELPESKQHEFHNTFSREFLEHLDRGHGACVLKRPDLAAIMAENLGHFDGERYILGDFVVMPNHVHLLVCLLGATDIEDQCYSWKKYTATRINKVLARHGRFWHEESFDHLVRKPAHFEHLRRYIGENPKKARLRENEYLHWRRP